MSRLLKHPILLETPGFSTIANFGTYSTPNLPSVTKTEGTISVKTFRQHAFVPELPLHIRGGLDVLPAIRKWFASGPSILLNEQYFDKVPDLVHLHLPYEFTCDPAHPDEAHAEYILSVCPDYRIADGFTRFMAPLSHLSVCQRELKMRGLYIAQAQLRDLPKALQADLPTPKLVMEAGKGDIYDANLWMGVPPTYTPLHKDPNPNMFVQLAGKKTVLLFKPAIGQTIFREVMCKIGQASASSAMRGDEMMLGDQKREFEKAVWSEDCAAEGLKCVVAAGDAVFIPKGWWHTIRSVDLEYSNEQLGINASVNWWFR